MELTFCDAITKLRQYSGAQSTARLVGQSQSKNIGDANNPQSYAFATKLVGIMQLRAEVLPAPHTNAELAVEDKDRIKRMQLIAMMEAFAGLDPVAQQSMASEVNAFISNNDSQNPAHRQWAEFLTACGYDIADILTKPEDKHRMPAESIQALRGLMISIGRDPYTFEPIKKTA
ncbi:MAG: hypothetical protein OSB62_01075 [Alphaproteobacteria bacterium]|nr:hypothetical protein [Alphaproteobacteria bacterium]